MKARTYYCAVSGAILCALSLSCGNSGEDSDQAEIRASVQRLRDAVQAKDVDSIMEYYVPDESLLVYDAIPPRQYAGAKAYRKDWEGFLGLFHGNISAQVVSWTVSTDGNMGYGYGPFRIAGTDKEGNPLDLILRVTDVYRKSGGKWLCVHEHVSWPVDLATGKVDLQSTP